MGTIKNRPTAYCLDLTRLISRVGRGPWTGIDRVEYEYLKALLTGSIETFSIIKIGNDYALLSPEGTRKVFKKLAAQEPWGKPDVKSWVHLRQNSTNKQATSDIRRIAYLNVRKSNLAQKLSETLPSGTAYFNVGHSNLTVEMFEAIQVINHSQINVMLHDTIPLDYPQYQRKGVSGEFSEKVRLVANYADRVICNSRKTQSDILRHMPDPPETIVAYLGVNVASPDPEDLPIDIKQSGRYFVSIGTIEPRKNHLLLLSIWQRFSKEIDPPHLFIVGQRGWENKAVFKQLDRGPANVTELNNLGDGAVSALLEKSCGLLFPSFAEGYGLPAAEAAKHRVPVICNDLRVFHEILGNYPIYADVADIYDWETKIRKLASYSAKEHNGEREYCPKEKLQTWEEHFNLVLA